MEVVSRDLWKPGEPLGDEAAEDEVYLSFEDVPLDEDPGEDGDDSLLVNGEPLLGDLSVVKVSPGWLSLLAPETETKDAPRAVKKRRLVVPHPRDLKRNMRGNDVLALQRALAAAGLRRWGTFTRTYGRGTVKQVQAFQRRRHLTADGVYGQATHRALAPLYDGYGIRLVNSVHVTTPNEKRRATLVAAAMVIYNYRDRIHYTQGPARMWLVRNRVRPNRVGGQRSIYEDCSSTATWLHWAAGVRDPNGPIGGRDWSGWGFTGTQCVHGVRVPTAQAKAGALSFYGRRPPYVHVVIHLGGGRVLSHGSEIGPLLLNVYYRGDLATTHAYRGLD